MWTPAPILQRFRRALGLDSESLRKHASRIWEIAPLETTIEPKAHHLPGQFDRVERCSEFSLSYEQEKRLAMGGNDAVHLPTYGLVLKDAFLVDGVLYHGDAWTYLHPRVRRWPTVQIEQEIGRAAVYCTPGGSGFFGQWLIDDCVTYLLAREEGIPVTTHHSISNHMHGYETMLGMDPSRQRAAYFREVVVFEDRGHNTNKRDRFRRLGQKLLEGRPAKPHPGVFVLRRTSGARRVLVNELEVAEYLRDRRGFRILDPFACDVQTIVKTCAGARVVAGVEGSHLVHGLLLLPPGGSLLTIQHPLRYCALLKALTDRDGQHFGFVVGTRLGNDFRVDPEEVERTLDLFPNQTEDSSGQTPLKAS